MYPRITTLLAVTLLLNSEAKAWDWWWSTPPEVPLLIEKESSVPEVEPLTAEAGTTSFWVHTGSGNWNDVNSWSPFEGGSPPGTVPNSQDATAAFSRNPSTTPASITNGANQTFTIGTLLLDASPSGNITFVKPNITLQFQSSNSIAVLQALSSSPATYLINSDINLLSPLTILQGNPDPTALQMNGVISGPHSVVIAGEGAVTFKGVNTYTGITDVQSGTLHLNSSGTSIPDDLLVESGATVIFESNSQMEPSGTIFYVDGSGQVNFSNTDQACLALVLTQSTLDTGSGSLAIAFGGNSINLQSSQLAGNFILPSNGSINVSNNPGTDSFIAATTIDVSAGNLTLLVQKANQFDLFTIATTVQNCLSIDKLGQGTWVIDGGGTNSFPATTVSQGTLTIQSLGSTVFTGDLTIIPGATLSMPETVSFTAPTLFNNGTVSLSSQQDAEIYHLTGDYTQGAAGNLLLNIANTHVAAVDKLMISGTASLNGTLTVNVDSEDIVIDKDAVVIIDAGSVTGTFSTISTNFPPDLKVQVGYTPSAVFLLFNGNHIPSFNLLQSSGYMNFMQPLFAQNDAHNLQMVRRCAFLRDRLKSSQESPLIGLLASAEESPQQLSVSSFRNNPEGKSLSLYAAPLGSLGHFKRIQQQKTFHYNAVGGLVGADYAFARAGIGAQLGYEHLHARVHDHWGHFDTNNLFGRFYGTFKPFTHVPFFIDANIGGGGEWYDIHRNTTRGTAQGKPQGWEWDAYLGLGYDSWLQGIRLTPLVALQSMGIYMQKYSEKGAGTHDLLFSRQNMTSLRSDIGFSLGGKWIRNKFTWIPEVRGYWQHEYLGHNKHITVATSITNLTEETTVMGLDKNYGIIGTEQRFLFGDRWSLAADYDYQWSYHQRSNNLLIELSLYF